MSEENSFDREGQHKKKGYPSSWRKPKGTHSRARRKEKDAAPMPNPGYRKPSEIRGLHPSGYRDVIVNRPEDLEELDPETDAARIASKVGGRKREQIVDKADDLGVKLLNAGDQRE
jgi:large subunit ribosomal protein L32e